jgi:A/G-specific adenine glycosylase
MRVLCRVDLIESDPRDKPTQDRLWHRAEEILPRKRVGAFNSALMELGATVCTPRSPQCLICPVQAHCEAFAAGVQDRIPAPRKAKETPLLRRVTFCVRWGDQWLIEQRPASGRWAGMWQFITVEAGENGEEPLPPKALASRHRRLPVRTANPRHLGTVTHGLTHRRYHFDVFTCDASGDDPPAAPPHRVWTTLEGLTHYPLPRPHLKIAEMLGRL